MLVWELFVAVMTAGPALLAVTQIVALPAPSAVTVLPGTAAPAQFVSPPRRVANDIGARAPCGHATTIACSKPKSISVAAAGDVNEKLSEETVTLNGGEGGPSAGAVSVRGA